MPPSKMDTPNYRVLHVIEVPPEVVTSSYDPGGSPRGQVSPETAPASPGPREGRIFPQYIYINYQGFMQTADPFWEPPDRLPMSCLYTSNSGQRGHVSCSKRMAQWLDGIPGPEEQSVIITDGSSQIQGRQPHDVGEERHGRMRQDQLPRDKRPGCQSISGPLLVSSTHHMGAAQGHRPSQPNPGVPIPSPSTSAKGGSALPRPHHPNPLGQHPVVFEELPIQLRIPKRKSSLRYNLQSSHPNPSAHSTIAPDDLIQGVQAIQIGKPVQFTGSELAGGHRDSSPGHQLDSQLDEDTFMADAPPRVFNNNHQNIHDPAAHQSLTSPVEQILGQGSGKTNPKKHARSETPATMETQPPMKRIRGALGQARNRLSLVVTPADGIEDGRQSRLGRLASTAARRLSLPVARYMMRIPGFRRGVEDESIRIGFVGDTGCGKTKLIQRFATGSFNIEHPYREVRDMGSYAVEIFHLDVDGERVLLETWDVSSQCDYMTPADHCRPLTTAPFTAVVICFDIQDEATLQSAASKWATKAEIHFNSAPVVLVGLKQDLRPGFPTLKLLHLNEPSATSIGQGEMAARDMGAVAYYECSALTGEGVADVVEAAVRIALARCHHDKGCQTKVQKFVKSIKKKYHKYREHRH